MNELPKTNQNVNLASVMYHRIEKQIADFYNNLENNHQMLVVIDDTIVEYIAYNNPYLLIFTGKDFQGNLTQKLIHVNQLNMNLISMNSSNSEKPEKSIGFLGEIY